MIKFLHKFEESAIGLLLVATTLLVFIEVVLRFVFNTGLLWAQELTLYMSAWMVLMGASWGIREGAHIGVDAFVKKLPKSSQKVVTLIALAMCLAYCGMFLYGSWIYLSKMHLIGIEMEDFAIEKWKAMSCLLFGFLLLTLRIVVLAIQVIKGERLGFGFADEAKESMHLAEGNDQTELPPSNKEGQ
ncbi:MULTISPECIES: TRAP transporter small permease [Photobacterium]|jgi:C4-dicarboxylate transporter, DctQ subunit|uniref:TRAP transporter small permease protein n=2 Tax=Photobacterium TaxID=657 RepID=A0A2T3JBZ8_9GAMM|nr:MULTISPECIES: TRAP transporter small permease [Photobacterium]PSU46372.1 TRAP transporter small permease [Photobacterium frigidiphilum]PSV49051.1 TRAP transporter small permease [Photobacterium indicum]